MCWWCYHSFLANQRCAFVRRRVSLTKSLVLVNFELDIKMVTRSALQLRRNFKTLRMRLVRCCKDPHAHSTSYVIDLCVVRHDECVLMYVRKVGKELSRMCDISLSPRYPGCRGRYRPTLRTAVCYVFVLSFARPIQRLCTPRLHLPLILKVESFLDNLSRLLALPIR